MTTKAMASALLLGLIVAQSTFLTGGYTDKTSCPAAGDMNPFNGLAQVGQFAASFATGGSRVILIKYETQVVAGQNFRVVFSLDAGAKCAYLGVAGFIALNKTMTVHKFFYSTDVNEVVNGLGFSNTDAGSLYCPGGARKDGNGSGNGNDRGNTRGNWDGADDENDGHGENDWWQKDYQEDQKQDHDQESDSDHGKKNHGKGGRHHDDQESDSSHSNKHQQNDGWWQDNQNGDNDNNQNDDNNNQDNNDDEDTPKPQPKPQTKPLPKPKPQPKPQPKPKNDDDCSDQNNGWAQNAETSEDHAEWNAHNSGFGGQEDDSDSHNDAKADPFANFGNNIAQALNSAGLNFPGFVQQGGKGKKHKGASSFTIGKSNSFDD